MKHTYHCTFSMTLEIDEKVFKRGTSKQFADYIVPMSTYEVAEHIAHNYGRNGITLSQIDGMADLPDKLVKVVKRLELDDGEKV